MSQLSPWQLLVWIAGLEIISAPILIFIANSIMIGYYKVKEAHQKRVLGTTGKILETFTNELENKIKAVMPTKVKEESDNANKADL